MSIENREYKLVLLGGVGAGKSALCTRLSTGEYGEHYVVTSGAVVHPLFFNSNRGPIKFNVSDIGSAEKPGYFSGPHYQEADCAIIMIDVTSRMSLNPATALLEDFRLSRPTVPVVLLANKIDSTDRKLKQNHLERFAKKMNLPLFVGSVSLDTGLVEPFQDLARKLSSGDDGLVFWEDSTTGVPAIATLNSINRRLLLSQDFSDVTFVCPNGAELPAHKAVLSAASDVFRVAFSGPWGESHSDGRWETTNSPKVMYAVLAFVYMGRLPSIEWFLENVQDLLGAAHKFNLVGLVEVCAERLLHQLSVHNVKSCLQLADLYGCNKLENACFDFVRENALGVLTNPDFVALATQDSDLWDKLRTNMTSK